MKTPYAAILALIFILSGCSQDRPHNPFSRGDKNTLRIAIQDLPDSYDPGQARSLASATTLRLAYEGLLRKSPDGQLVPGIADSWEVSENGLIYRFFLRDALWSNEQPVTAEDFVFAWKRQLAPDFPAPNAFLLYPIKGAKAAKTEEGSIDQIAIRAVGSKILEVELEAPSATFLELTTFHSLFPLCKTYSEENPNWNTEGFKSVLSNGPFHPESLTSYAKNPTYWDQESVSLSHITFFEEDENTAVLLFEQGELDWIGSPLSTLPSDTLSSLKDRAILKIAPAAGTQFLRFNTTDAVLSDPKVRRALAFAINRDAICEQVLQAGQSPATALVPPYISGVDRSSRSLFLDSARVAARSQLSQTNAHRSEIVLTYAANNERYHKLAQVLQHQWRDALGLQVKLERMEAKVVYDRLKSGDYQVAIGAWFADIDDPSSFLDVFERADNGTNNTGWESSRYQELLAKARIETDISRRTILLQEAEALLIEEMPIAPINTFTFAFLQSEEVEGAFFSPLGYLDFKYANKK